MRAAICNAPDRALRASQPFHSRQLDAQCRASSAPLRDLLDAPTALAACCGFDLCHKYILYLYLYLYLYFYLFRRRHSRWRQHADRNLTRRVTQVTARHDIRFVTHDESVHSSCSARDPRD
jgi:hypothetical protein